MRSGLKPTLLIKMCEIFVFIEGVIEWPSEDEAPPEDARDLVTRLLEQDPIVRLGTTGALKSVVIICASTRDLPIACTFVYKGVPLK